jgi:DNA-binding response OmpR family regulator
LLADDDRSFQDAVAEACGNAGYQGIAAENMDETIQWLRRRHFDLLIANLELPGNSRMRIVQEARKVAPGLAIIVTTGAPSVSTAVEAVELPVLAYLPKPVDLASLLQRISAILQSRPGYRTLGVVIGILHRCAEELEQVRSGWAAGEELRVPGMAIRALSASMVELLSLGNTHGASGQTGTLCEHIGCPRWKEHEAAFRDVIDVLQETKRRFKSKELAELRERLHRHLRISEK